MSDKLYTEIPSLDLADFTSGDPVKKKQFVADLGQAYQNIGFVAIKTMVFLMNLQKSCMHQLRSFLVCLMR